MLNLFKRPIEPEIKEDWSKLTLDIAKVALLAIPVVVYGNSCCGVWKFAFVGKTA